MKQFLIETDVLGEYLVSRNSLLRTALLEGVCYTTMYNALEIFRLAKNEAEREVLKNMLSVVRVLGFNYRYAEQFALIIKEIEEKSDTEITQRETLIIGMAKTSKLTILTREYYERYKSLYGVDVASEAVTVPSE
ncbi:MAG TPA: hypothetical protein VIX80_04535 [Candidatus Kapabacteria bacterium]